MSVVSDNWKLLIISFVLANAAMFQFSYLSIYISPSQASFTDYINQSYYVTHDKTYLDGLQFTWIWSVIVNCYQLGFLLGTIVAPWIVERIGRKWILLISGLFDVVGTVISVIAIPLQLSSLLASGRTIIGVGSGLSCCGITLYLQEISPTNVRGLVSSFQEMSVSFIGLIGTILGVPSVLGSVQCLPYLIGLSILPALGKLILLWCPETPKYLYLHKDNLNGAKKSILFYHPKNVDVDHVMKEIFREGELEKEDYLNFVDLEVVNDPVVKKSRWKLVQLLNVPHLRKAVLIGMVTFVVSETTGIVPLTEYTTDLLEDISVPTRYALLFTVLTGVANTVATFMSLFMVEKFGRRKLLLSGFSGLVLCLVAFMICYFIAPSVSSNLPGYFAAVIMVIYGGVYGFGPGIVPWFITSELVPQSVRSTAQSFVQIFNILSNLIVSVVFLPAFNAWGPYSYLIFIIPTTLGIIFLYFELPETKNREITDIVIDLKTKIAVNKKKSKLNY